MNIESVISNKLKYIKEYNIWTIEGVDCINYSDGDVTEDYIYNSIKSSKDIRTDSLELETYIKDWPSRYHLGRHRSQLLKGFNYSDDIKNVLEVGSGCGAISRTLGECLPNANIVGVEGSLNRAKIARERTRDLKNVQICTGAFQDIKYNVKFDAIFCIGVFEYSALFVDGKDPFRRILDYLNSLLTEDGVLIIAIENQFGLKYFSGTPEDHTDIRFDSLEGYPTFNSRKVKTFGKNYLTSLLRGADFNNTEFYFPFPDYKLPHSIVSERALLNDKINLGGLVGVDKSQEYRVDDKKSFNDKLVWWELGDNNLIHYFSNSFLVFSSKKKAQNIIQTPWDAIVYSPGRKKEYCAETHFKNLTGDSPLIEKIYPYQSPNNVGPLIRKKARDTWAKGYPLELAILKNIKENSADIDQYLSSVRQWIDFLKKHYADKSKGTIESKYFDAMYWNLVMSPNEEIEYIDDEWVWEQPILMKTIVLRGMYYLLRLNKPIVNKLSSSLRNNFKEVMKYLCGYLYETCDESDIDVFIDFESDLQSVAGVKAKEELINYFKSVLNEKIYEGKYKRITKRVLAKVRNLKELL